MSRFLFRVPKLPSRNYALQMQSFRLFSYPSYCQRDPYFILGKPNNIGDGDGINFFSLRTCCLCYLKKEIPCELLEGRGLIGASRGWVATLKKRIVCLHDDMNLTASESNPKRISLPPLVTLPHCQTQIVTSVAMSSSSPENDDCIVAVKFLGPQLSLIRPSQDSMWTNIRIADPSFSTSNVMFSQRDKMFSLPASGGSHMGSWDLHKHRDKPKLQKLLFQNLPRLRKTERELLDSCYKTEHLVESSAGETFLVIWYRYGTEDMSHFETKDFRVFKLDGNGNAFYTKDIGDFSIFLSKSEPFCETSLFLLDRNCIYYVDVHESKSTIELGGFSLRRPGSAEINFSTHHATKVPYYFPKQAMR
ncbi:hypothetical protein EUTSA_v10027810mg [Eutrema salsugineum]|uniref:KIB1-4 beta-propeller domain-containing protein n=1 Tax=Eutrema salsugineum TaxID=72664 RepID=V4LST7_EUTSA|nr:uncharacterized protein LOC18023007 [Eutrema salsugineum]ESQ46889.1 hypothetical protein EUTSA_v10027810mg [Eutrema salsugineum]